MIPSSPRALWRSFAITLCFAIAGNVLVGDPLSVWYAGLVKPWFLVPIGVLVIVGLIYYVLMGAVLYRIQRHVAQGRARRGLYGGAILVMTLNESWNYLFFGLRSAGWGFAGMVFFWLVLTAWLVPLWSRERISAHLVAVYWLWVGYDVAWTYALWQQNR